MRVANQTRNNREIERKFLLKQPPDQLKRSRHYIIEQGYLATEPAGRQVRLRKKGKTASLTFKVGRGAHREEREIKLSPKGIFRSLELSLLRRPYIIEERHETVVHVQLLVAVEKRQTRIVSNKVHLGLLVSAHRCSRSRTHRLPCLLAHRKCSP